MSASEVSCNKALRTDEPEPVVVETRDNISSFLIDYFSCRKTDDFQDTPLSDLTAIFLEFHAKFEKPARKEIKDNIQNPIYRNRLKRGMAWGALSSYILDKHRIENTQYKRNLLSLYLDRLVDYGIAVPIIANLNGKVYRAYRHGEDVRYGAQEESLIYKALQGFQSGRNSEGFERTYLEKLIVILLRVGMNEEWLNLWYSRSGRDNLVRVGYNLQGAVPITPTSEDELIPEIETSWLTRRLCRVGTVIEPCEQGGLYKLGNEPEAAHARKDAGRTAKSLGYAVGLACTSGGKQRNANRPIGTEDLIIITSCANLPDTVSAAAAEMKLFANWYREYGRQMLLGYVNRNRSGKESATVSGSNGEEAVNSGTWKIRKYEEKEIEKIKLKLHHAQETNKDLLTYQDHWDAVFQAFNLYPNEEDEKRLIRILATEKRILYGAQSALDFMEILFAYRKDSEKREKIKNLLSKIKENPYPIMISDQEASRIFDTLFSTDNSTMVPISEMSALSKALDREILTLVEDAKREVEFATSTILKLDKKLGRLSYRFLIWYDILDVRVRKKITHYSIDEYAHAINKFRALTNSMLADYLEYMRNIGGNMFCDTGDIKSTNDEKHIFLSARGSGENEGFRLAGNLIKIAGQCNVNIRIIATLTNLRGDYVYLNRGENSIDGDFKSHVHTLIQDIKHSELEESLNPGQSIMWLVNKSADRCEMDSSIFLAQQSDPKKVLVNIRGFKIEDQLTPVICSV